MTDATSVPRAGRPWLVLGAMGLPLLALSMDINGVGTLLAPIQDELDVSTGAIGWVVNASALTFAALLVAVGKVAPRLGARRLVLAGVVTFGLASLLCAAAPSFPVLIVGRVAQGVGGVLMFTTSLAVIDRVFDERRRAAAIGAWGMINGVGGAVGPLVGGAVTSWWSWRAFFAIGAPICLVAVPVISVLTPRDGPAPAPVPLPIGRLVLLAVGVVALSLGIQTSATAGWGSPATMSALAVAALGLGGLVVASRRPGVVALVADAVVRAPRFRPALIVGFTANWGFGVAIVFMGLELQTVRGLSPLEAGLMFSVFSAACALAGLGVAPLSRHLGLNRALVLAMVLIAVPFAAGGLMRASTALVLVGIGLAVGGLGQGLAFDLSTLASLDGVPQEAAGEASGVVATVRSLGLTIGIAASTSLALAVGGGTADEVHHGIEVVFAAAAGVAVIGAVGAFAFRRSLGSAPEGPDGGGRHGQGEDPGREG